MEWQTRHLNDELWLRARRLLVTRLRGLGLDSSTADYRTYFAGQHASGVALRDGLVRRLGPERAAELAAESFLGAGNRRFRLRLPFILAFTAEYAGWLTLLAPVPAERRETVRELAALFNLGIVLVDQISDRPNGREDLGAIFGGGRLGRLLADPAAARELRAAADELPRPEPRVLAAVVAAFFSGVAELADEVPRPRLLERLGGALAAAYRGQIAADGAGDVAALRAKSVTPFVVPPLLALLAGAADRHGRLPLLGERLGEVFWRVDDLVDVGRDAAFGDGNLILLRVAPESASGTPAPPSPLLARLLDDGVLEAVAGEAGEHAVGALDLLTDRPEIREEASRWLEMYVLDWLR